jgi:phosphatidylserine/phosphatidylglycerophosphate/cardiolipin synthase-like enzyme
MSINSDFQFFTTPEYFSNLAETIASVESEGRAMIMTMTFQPDRPEVGRIMKELCAAARRGADVRLFIDAKPFLLPGGAHSVGVIPGPLFFNVELPLRLKKRFKNVFTALEELQDAGGTYKVINQPGKRFRNPISGRSHIKFSIINDIVYTGGCNLDSDSHIDEMIRWEGRAVADRLINLGHKIEETGVVKLAMGDQDMAFNVDDTTEMLIDSGVKGQSIILQRALDLIDRAQEFIVISSQFFPNDVTSRHLLAAHKRGVKIRVFYNHPSQFDLPHNLLHYSVVGKAKLSLPKKFFADAQRATYIHAKVVVSEIAAIIGSHNQVSIGVKLGTAELDLYSSDPAFGRRILDTLDRQIVEKSKSI